MRKILFFIFFLIFSIYLLPAQVNLSERDAFADTFNQSILHIKDLQSFFGKSVTEMNTFLELRNHEHIMEEPDNQIWSLNPNQLYDLPAVYLIYHQNTQIIQYVCIDSSLINYLFRDFPRNYRSTSENIYSNGICQVARDRRVYDVDERPVTMWLLELTDLKEQERRRAEYAEKLKAYTKSMDVMEQKALRILDTVRMSNQQVELLTEELQQSVRMGDEYHSQHKYAHARGAYNEAADKYYKTVYPEMEAASLYVRQKKQQIIDEMTRIEQGHAPLTFNDLEKNYDGIISAYTEMDNYVAVYGMYNGYGLKLETKRKVNDCDEIERDYRQVYQDRATIEQLYDQKGYDRLKSDAESRMMSFEADREFLYNKYKDLLVFLKVSKPKYERTYNEIGEAAMNNMLRQTYDSLLLCAIQQSPSIENVNLRRTCVLKLDNLYKPLYRQNSINLNDYKRSSLLPQIVDIVMSQNKAFSKEYFVNGKYFKDKVAFFNSYTSAYYETQVQNLKKAEKERREQEMRAKKQEQLRQQEAANRQNQQKNTDVSINPPVSVFALGLTTGMGLDLYSDLAVDYHFGMYIMFPTSKRVSWGLFYNIGLRGTKTTLYMNGGLQLFHGQYDKWQFLWGAGAGYDFKDGFMGSLRLGTRYRMLVLFADVDVVPESSTMVGFKLGIGINIGR